MLIMQNEQKGVRRGCGSHSDMHVMRKGKESTGCVAYLEPLAMPKSH